MKPLDWFAAVAFLLLFGVPVYWLVVHPFAGFWRRRSLHAAYWTAVLMGWGAAAAVVVPLREYLFHSEGTPLWAIVAGVLLLVADLLTMLWVARELGHARLVGRAELRGEGELKTDGIYGRVRHPRYTAMMAAMLGVALMAGTILLWVFVAAWWMLALLAVAFEERELHQRFGEAYDAYRERVPAFLPFRIRAQGE
jgi:protein-S-isoprenylcysteine O-methyltransferase Ste14